MGDGLLATPLTAGATEKSTAKMAWGARLEHTGGQECSKSRMIPANNGLTGVYAGFIPCADCEGIQYRLALNGDGSFRKQLTYKGKSAKAFITKGRYSVQGDTLVKLAKKDPDGDVHEALPIRVRCWYKFGE